MKIIWAVFKYIAYFVPATLVSLLPEKVKQRDPLLLFNRSSIHVICGLLECLTGFIALFCRFIYQAQHPSNLSIAIATSPIPPGTSVASPQMLLGLAGLALFLLQPSSLVLQWMVLEGFVRALSAFLAEQNYGIAIIVLPYRLISWMQRGANRLWLKCKLGPPRQDTVTPADRTASGLLEICSATEKEWSSKQVVRHSEELYILQEQALNKDARYWSYCYRLRKMRPGEPIRTVIVDYGPHLT
jgi:hypothetical protein